MYSIRQRRTAVPTFDISTKYRELLSTFSPSSQQSYLVVEQLSNEAQSRVLTVRLRFFDSSTESRPFERVVRVRFESLYFEATSRVVLEQPTANSHTFRSEAQFAPTLSYRPLDPFPSLGVGLVFVQLTRSLFLEPTAQGAS